MEEEKCSFPICSSTEFMWQGFGSRGLLCEQSSAAAAPCQIRQLQPAPEEPAIGQS